MVKINTWPLDKKSDPDLYVKIISEDDGDDQKVDDKNYMFKSD